jgi:NAD(P)-dependent dehydrogenase (short-subunit alcohol dehydrogenase family)
MATPLFDLTGKVALITGGSKGLGKAMARGFAEAGADIVISPRSWPGQNPRDDGSSPT